MGDRVAVMRKGLLQQVEPPQVLYDHPRNLFVAGFIGSPAMNMVEAAVSRANGAFFVEFGGFRLRVDDEALKAHPGLSDYDGRRVVVGLRPEIMEDAALSPGAPDDRRIFSIVALREALGSQIAIHFGVEAPPVLTEDTKELIRDIGEEPSEQEALRRPSTFVAQLDPKSDVRIGERVELFVDTARLHFFDPATGLGIYGS